MRSQNNTEKIKGERLLISGYTEDYSVIIEALKRSKFKPKEIISLKEKIHPMLKSLAREKNIPIKVFYFDKGDWKEKIKERNLAAIKYCNRVINLGKPSEISELAESMKKKVFNWEYWRDH